jgi:hypothetical protein
MKTKKEKTKNEKPRIYQTDKQTRGVVLRNGSPQTYRRRRNLVG